MSSIKVSLFYIFSIKFRFIYVEIEFYLEDFSWNRDTVVKLVISNSFLIVDDGCILRLTLYL